MAPLRKVLKRMGSSRSLEVDHADEALLLIYCPALSFPVWLRICVGSLPAGEVVEMEHCMAPNNARA